MIYNWDYTKKAKVLAPAFLNHRLGLVAVCVVIVIALVLFPEQMLPALGVMGLGAHDTRCNGEDDRHDDKCCYHGDGDDLSYSDRTGWRKDS